jgi:thiol-disulfide isomerase/thioredoxin
VAAAPPRDVIARGRRVGHIALGVAAAMAALQLGWIALHAEELRPVTSDEPAPAFALPEIGAGGKLGAKIAVRPGQPALPASEVRPILIDFWATWCGVCLRGMPQLEAFRKAHPEIDMISVNLDDAVVARQIFDAKGYGLRLLFDDNAVSKRYNVSVLPHLVVVDRNGRVHQVVRGHPGELEALLPASSSGEHAER